MTRVEVQTANVQVLADSIWIRIVGMTFRKAAELTQFWFE